jgi:hypothetical protein
MEVVGEPGSWVIVRSWSISYDIYVRYEDQLCWLDRTSATLRAAYLQNQCCGVDQSCYFVQAALVI